MRLNYKITWHKSTKQSGYWNKFISLKPCAGTSVSFSALKYIPSSIFWIVRLPTTLTYSKLWSRLEESGATCRWIWDSFRCCSSLLVIITRRILPLKNEKYSRQEFHFVITISFLRWEFRTLTRRKLWHIWFLEQQLVGLPRWESGLLY